MRTINHPGGGRDPLLREVSERDQSYHGEGKTLELD